MLYSNFRKRDLYLQQLKAFRDTEMIKVITCIRRCGKSSMMKLMANELRISGVAQDQIIEIDLNPCAFRI